VKERIVGAHYAIIERLQNNTISFLVNIHAEKKNLLQL